MTALIELVEITKDYGDIRALDHVSLEIRAGITGLLGPNGSGKSTLIKVMLGLLRKTGGHGRILDYELGVQNREIRAKVGYMPEDDCYLHGMTGVEAVQFMSQLSLFPDIEGLRRAHEILDFCGVNQERYRTVETYSTGMRQKLRFAQAIVHDPPILILDEPTSGLDPEERESMLNRIRLLARDYGKTVILCTHILPDIQAISDDVVILAQGKLQVADSLDVLSRPIKPSINIRIVGQLQGLKDRLTGAGLRVKEGHRDTLVVHGSPQELSTKVWSAARAEGVSIRSLTPSRNSLEQIFLDAVQGEDDGDS